MSTPTSITQLITALNGALPTRFKPCEPTPTDGHVHISIAYPPPETAPAVGAPTQLLCNTGEGATVVGPGIYPHFVICAECWALFLAEEAKAVAAAVTK